MTDQPSIIINAAGRGTRLGKDRPKCLVEFLGQPLIYWQLQTVPEASELIVAIGFHADDVKQAVLDLRPDARFVYNERYAATGTASSLCLAARQCSGPVLSLDGDMLVHPDDLRRLLSFSRPCIGLSPIQSNAPVLVEVAPGQGEQKEHAIRFVYQAAASGPSYYEWTGLVVFDPASVPLDADGHVFQMITPLLPCNTVHVRCCEIDFPAELPLMERWIATLVNEGAVNE